MSTLAQIIVQSENNTVEQNSAVLDAVADYSTDLATFVASSSVVINDTVSKKRQESMTHTEHLFLSLCRLLMTWFK